jgi:hypothetical protein
VDWEFRIYGESCLQLRMHFSCIRYLLAGTMFSVELALNQPLRVRSEIHETSQSAREEHDGGGAKEGSGGCERRFRVLPEPSVSADPGEEPFDQPSARVNCEPDLIGRLPNRPVRIPPLRGSSSGGNSLPQASAAAGRSPDRGLFRSISIDHYRKIVRPLSGGE